MPPFCVLTTVRFYDFNEQKTADSILQAARWRMVILENLIHRIRKFPFGTNGSRRDTICRFRPDVHT